MDNLPSIPWEIFSEEEIQYIIERVCERNGWEVYNLHKIQRNMEQGADLIVKKEDARKIAIAVKKKPGSGDRAQLKDLSEREEEEKLYIYIQNPTPGFKKWMEELKNSIKFLNKIDFNRWLFEIDPCVYSSLLLDNCEFSHKLLEIQKFLISLFLKSEKFHKDITHKHDEDSLRTLWRLKDDVVTINKSLRCLQTLFETAENKRPNLKEDVEFLRGLINTFDDMLINLQHLHKNIKKFAEKEEEFIFYVIRKTKDRSNWIYIASFKLYTSDNVIRGRNENEEIFLKELSKILNKSIAELLKDEKRFAIIGCLANTCRRYANFVEGVENFIDDLFSYGIWNELHTYTLHQEDVDFV